MIESFYNALGFAGALVTAFILFIFFIFWMAGLAGICMKKESEHIKWIRVSVAILIPLYPFFWMIWDMIVQKRDLRRT